MGQGTIKDFEDGERTGTLLMDDGSEISIDAASLEGSDVRMLRLGQRVRFEIEDRDGSRFARSLKLVTWE